jgi:hypothetical protein
VLLFIHLAISKCGRKYSHPCHVCIISYLTLQGTLLMYLQKIAILSSRQMLQGSGTNVRKQHQGGNNIIAMAARSAYSWFTSLDLSKNMPIWACIGTD